MTNKQAINILLNEQKCIDRNDGVQCNRECGSCDLVMDVEIIREAYNMAISALEERDVPDTNVGDMISRQEAIDEIDEWIKAFLENGHKESAADACLIQDGIIQLPSAQPEIVRCKDCKHSRFFDPCFYCYEFGEEINVPENGFCFMAKRRADECTD